MKMDVLGMKYLHENGCPWNEECCENASKTGHLEVLKYLHENKCPYVSKNIQRIDNIFSNVNKKAEKRLKLI